MSANSMDKRTSHRLSVLCNFQKQPAEWAKKSPSTTASLGALHQLLFLAVLAITCIAMHCYALCIAMLCYAIGTTRAIFRHFSTAQLSSSSERILLRFYLQCSSTSALFPAHLFEGRNTRRLYDIVCIICKYYIYVCVFTLSVCICPVFFVVLICMV